MTDNTSKTDLLIRWRLNCFRSQIANYNAANRFSKRNYWLGIPAVLLSAIVGTSVFAALGKNVDVYLQIAVGIVSVLASVLAALQTFLKWGELASKCRASAAEYGSVKRQIDQIISMCADEEEITKEEVCRIREQMDSLARECPELPEDIWQKARSIVPPAGEKNNA